MNIVVTMAGSGIRFQERGYNLPKYMIEALGKTLFEWSMISLKNFNIPNNKFIFIVRKEHEATSFIIQKCKKLYIQNYTIVQLDELTDGQATTALFAKKHWNKNEELLIYNIDTYVEEGELKHSDIKGDGFIPCFKAPGTHWSFVKLNDNGMAIEVREKDRISDNCSLGAYYFKSCKLYEELYNDYYKNNSTRIAEKYIATMYNQLISKGGKVFITTIPFNKIKVLGTPEELNQFLLN